MWLSHGRRSSPSGGGVCAAAAAAADDDDDGCSLMKSDSFCMNQSFPSARNCTLSRVESSGNSQVSSSVAMRNLQISDLHCSLSVSPSSSAAASPVLESSLLRQLICTAPEKRSTVLTINPNKAVLSINSSTSQVLDANEHACKLFECAYSDLMGRKLTSLLRSSQMLEEVLKEEALDSDGNLVAISSKVVTAVSLTGAEFSVSVWLQIPEKRQQILELLLERVERITAHVTFTQNGGILSCDATFAHLNGYQAAEEVTGLSIISLMPSLQIPFHCRTTPKVLRVQRLCVQARSGLVVPACVRLQAAVSCGRSPQQINESGGKSGAGELLSPSAGVLYSGSVCVFAPSSCLLTLLPNGTIHSLNNPFSSLMLGYNSSQLLGKNVTYLIPAFYERVRAADQNNHSHESTSPSDSHAAPCRFSASAKCPLANVLTLSTDMTSTRDDQQDTCHPNTVLAGDSVMVHLAMRRRAVLMKGRRIFTGTSAKLEKENSVLSTMTSPAVTSTPLNGFETSLNPLI